MSKQYTGSIRNKVILITLLCTTAILVAVGIFDTFKVIENEKNQLRNLAEVTAERLAQHLVTPLWDLDSEGVGSAIEAEMLENHLLGITVYDENGTTVMSAKERDQKWDVSVSTGNIKGAFATSVSDVKTSDQVIGQVKVFVSDRFMHKEIQSLIIKEVIRVLLLNAAIFTILMLLLGKFLITPIRRLAEQASEISQGKLNTVIDVNSDDEIGMLADSMTRMQKSLIVTFKKIRQNNKVKDAQS
ncbi:HAMP domain-containing protein [Neptunomonas antarctica]|uniref:histidine kinase n=1 Tax=Neptunomonas antarctica TaxID=619304 RepID=A0A1N7KYF2_9GAMM|nr:HAMP domain-containing protein [Neptunomonas antarctica]SIS66613.1 HAMP domain-containing protein [Neptunomonas antarctica]